MSKLGRPRKTLDELLAERIAVSVIASIPIQAACTAHQIARSARTTAPKATVRVVSRIIGEARARGLIIESERISVTVRKGRPAVAYHLVPRSDQIHRIEQAFDCLVSRLAMPRF